MRKSRSLLEDASRDGALENALNTSATAKADPACTGLTTFAVNESVSEARAKMRALLESAMVDGSLESHIISVKDTVATVGSSQVDETRAKMQSLLASAVDDGSLENLLSDGAQKPESQTAVQASSERNIEDLRKQMRMRMEEALDSGELAAALRPKQPDTNTVAPAQDAATATGIAAAAIDSPGLYKIVKFTFA